MTAQVHDLLGLPARSVDGTTSVDLPDGSSSAVQSIEDAGPAERTVGLLGDDLDAAVAEPQAAGVATDAVAQTGTWRYARFRAPDGRLHVLLEQR